ncbi:ninein isoform X2 [Labrus bergylta]
MDDAQEQDHYEERLKELFNSFDGSSCGSLCLEELSDLCESLHLEEAAAALMQTLLQDQDRRAARVDFEQFKEALILVLSSSTEPVPAETETFPRAESPEIQPKFVKGSKRYGRRTTPEFIEPFSGTPEVRNAYSVEEEDPENVPRKRERWIAQETSPEEYEAEGQMHLWNPDELSTPRGAGVPLSSCLEDRLREACSELEIAWDGCADHNDLLALCEHLGLEIHVDILQNLTADGLMNVHQFVSMVTNQNKPPTPSASTPYRQLKRHHSTQPFDEGGRRIATPSALSSTIGMRLFSTLDDGSGFTAVEEVLDAWMEEGIENSAEILQALNFSLNEKLSLSDLTMALENELLVTKNGIHQAALASFKAEIRYLLEQVDRELREKEKIRSDLEKAEKQKTQLATEVDEHHSAIEHMNNLNLRKLEQEHREKLAAVRSELTKEMDLMQQQAGLQREELEAEVEKIKEDECFLRDHLSISVKENRRLEMELLDSTDKLEEAQIQISKLQSSLDNIIKERFGDLDLGSADLFLQEERIKQLRSSYEAQCRELQDRIDELQSELQEFHGLGRVLQPGQKSLCEELETKSPGMESDPGIGSEDVQTFSMSLEAEMMLEQLKEQHLQEMEDLRKQLERKINEFDQMVEKQRATHDEQKAALALQHQQEVQALREETDRFQVQTQELQSRLQEAHQERTQAEERKELEDLQEVKRLRQQLLETHTHSAHLEERLKTLEDQQEQSMEELRRQHAEEIRRLEEEHVEICEDRLREERQKVQGEKAELEKRLLEDYQTEKKLLQQSQEEELKIRGEEVKRRCEEKCEEVVQSLTEKWHREKAQLDEHNNEALQLLLEEEMLRLVREQEEKEATLREQLEERHEEALLRERGRVQVREEQLEEEREQLEREKEKEEKRLQVLISEERALLEERHQEAVKELTANHSEEREALSSTLDKLREDIVHERREIQSSFTLRIKEVEDRFSGDHEALEKRFQADVMRLEQNYQTQLKALSDGHAQQELLWEAQIQEAEEHRGLLEERERHELQAGHQQEVEELVMKNQQLQNELLDFISMAQTKEIELSMQLNDLHNRLQESLKTKDELLAQAEKKACEIELLLNQTVDDFKHEREEHVSSQTQLQTQYNQLLSMSERQSAERMDLLHERDHWKLRMEEMEMLLEQATLDFEVEREELQERTSMLQRNQEKEREELVAERHALQKRVRDLDMKLRQALSYTEHVMEGEDRETWRDPPDLDNNHSEREGEGSSPQEVRSSDEDTQNKEALESFEEEDPVGLEDSADPHKVCVGSPERPFSVREAGHVCDSEGDCAPDAVDSLDEGKEREPSVVRPQATEENVLLLEKISLLQQKTELLENLLAHNSEKMKNGQQILEENYGLKVKMLLLMEHVKELEIKALKMTDLQIRYEDCLCENSKVKEQNVELEKRVWSLESRMSLFPELQDQVVLVDEISRMRDENNKLSELFAELERSRESLLAERPDTGAPESLADESLLDQDLEGCCEEFEEQNSRLRRAITELQSRSQTLNQTTQTQRSETSRLAEENFVLRKKITTLKEEDLKEAQGELIQKLEHLKKGKMSAQRVAENLKKQISELRLQSQQLEDENGMLSEKNAQNIVDMETLRQQLAELIKDEDQNKLTACVSALEAELTAALEDAAKLEERNVQLSEQLSELREKNHVLEMSLHSSSLQNTKLYREEVCGLMEQDQLLLRRENERLQVEVHDIRGDLLQSREKIHQLDATISSLKQNRQQSQSSALQTALEQENATLRRELEAQRELNKGCEASRGHADVESLQQENEALRAQMTRMSSQLMESFQAQLVGLLPPSPHRIPRGQHRAEDPDNQQDERETKMKNMEERMREVELSLRNVKLLLREKVFQLRDQLHKNGKADVLITDLYMENAQLLKALEKTEKRQKISEKKNYLLEEKICSLNRIVRDLNPAPSLPYHF